MPSVDSENSILVPSESAEALERIRGEAEAEVERLIDLLDQIDAVDEREPDVDFEPDADDEPSLSITEAGNAGGCSLFDGEEEFASIDAEETRRQLRLKGVDGGEPMLGSLDCSDQTRWAAGNGDDREGDGCADDREHDEAERGIADADAMAELRGEPSLGWGDNADQTRLGADYGIRTDYEECEPLDIAKARRRGPATGVAVAAYGPVSKRLTGLTEAQRRRMRDRGDGEIGV